MAGRARDAAGTDDVEVARRASRNRALVGFDLERGPGPRHRDLDLTVASCDPRASRADLRSRDARIEVVIVYPEVIPVGSPVTVIPVEREHHIINRRTALGGGPRDDIGE